jgi:DNA repair protein RadC
MLIDLKKYNDGKSFYIKRSQDVIEILKPYYLTLDEVDKDKEHFFVIGLTRNSRAKYLDVVSIGNLYATIADPREIFRRAIMLAVHCIIIAHTHPSGCFNPSSIDLVLTEKIREAGRILGIELVDHLIFGEGETYYSFADEESIL